MAKLCSCQKFQTEAKADPGVDVTLQKATSRQTAANAGTGRGGAPSAGQTHTPPEEAAFPRTSATSRAAAAGCACCLEVSVNLGFSRFIFYILLHVQVFVKLSFTNAD